nr:hypothetical protein [Tanacetum cinerariifolium]
GRQAAAQPGTHRSHAAEHHGRAYRTARIPPACQPQAFAAGAPDHSGRVGAGAGVHPYQARRQPPGRIPGQARPERRGDPR